MEEDINHEKRVDAYRGGLSADEVVILDSINSELKENVFAETGKKDLDLLNIKDGFDLYGQEGQNLLSKDIKTFGNKQVWEKFHKLKYDIQNRFIGLPMIVSDWESKTKKLTLETILAGNYQEINTIFLGNDENQKKFCLNFIKDIATYTGLDTNVRRDLMRIINDTLAQKIDINIGLSTEIIGTMGSLYLYSSQDNEILNLSYTCFFALFEGLPKYISKQAKPESWLLLLILRNASFQEPNNLNTLIEMITNKLDIDIVADLYVNLLGSNINIVSPQITMTTLETYIIERFPNKKMGLTKTAGLFEYMLKNNQMDFFQQKISSFSLAKKTIFIYVFLFSAEYENNQQMMSYADQLIGSNKDIKDAFKILVCGTKMEPYQSVNERLYDKFLDGTIRLDASDVRQNVINKVLGQADPYVYEVLKYAGAETHELNIKKMIEESTNLIRDIRVLESKSLSIDDIGWISQVIDKQATEEAKEEVWFEFLFNNPQELIGHLVNFDIQKIFGFDRVFFDQLSNNSPDREDQEKLRNDLTKLSEIIKETGNIQTTRDLFATYNVTSYRRYSKKILKHMVENKERATGKPIFPIFMTKRDWNGALGNQLNEGGNLSNSIDDYDIRIFEPGDDNQKFFGDAGILEKFYTQYIAAGGKRENINSMIGMHGNPDVILKTKKLEPSEYIRRSDRDLFMALSKYLRGGTLTFLACSTGSNSIGESNIAQNAAKALNCRVMAPNTDTNLENIIYNKSGGIEFIDYLRETSTVIYDGREKIESKEDIITIDRDISDNIDILGNDGLGALDFKLQTGTFGNSIISQTENENKRKVMKGNDILFLEKKQNNGRYLLSIDVTGSTKGVFEIPYTAFSKWLPKIMVDSQGNQSRYENNFRVESDSKLSINIIGKTGVEENEYNKNKIYYNGGNIIIEVEEYENIKSIDVYDIGGKMIQKVNTIESNKIILDMQGRQNGAYIVRITNNNAVSSPYKVIIP